jgi:hypothetical protein
MRRGEYYLYGEVFQQSEIVEKVVLPEIASRL